MMTRRIPLMLLVAGLGACASQTPKPTPTPFSQAALPDAVKVPTGNAVSMEAAASSNIPYQCRAKKDLPGQNEWVFVGPEAGLVDRSDKSVGKYYGPPATWDSNDGSKVPGAQVAVAPSGAGHIPLQLVKANPAMGIGAMQGVAYIQRVATDDVHFHPIVSRSFGLTLTAKS